MHIHAAEQFSAGAARGGAGAGSPAGGVFTAGMGLLARYIFRGVPVACSSSGDVTTAPVLIRVRSAFPHAGPWQSASANVGGDLNGQALSAQALAPPATAPTTVHTLDFDTHAGIMNMSPGSKVSGPWRVHLVETLVSLSSTATQARAIEAAVYVASGSRPKLYARRAHTVISCMQNAPDFVLKYKAGEKTWWALGMQDARVTNAKFMAWSVAHGCDDHHVASSGIGASASTDTSSAARTSSMPDDVGTCAGINDLCLKSEQQIRSIAQMFGAASDSQGTYDRTCRRCKGKRHMGFRYQNRSGDEGMAFFFVCLECGLKTNA